MNATSTPATIRTFIGKLASEALPKEADSGAPKTVEFSKASAVVTSIGPSGPRSPSAILGKA